ncbi:class I SAM-dependent methyltransferase [Neobacillus sp. Marseille-QA0830]
MDTNYTNINSAVIDNWVDNHWEWGIPISHETYEKAVRGEWNVFLTPTKPVPKEWFPPLKGCRILGLASGGGQQMPIFTALGAVCTVMDYSQKQLDNEMMVANREGYSIQTVKADMTKPFPFEDGSFDLIFHPVSNCYIEDVFHVWKECNRVLKKGGILLAGMDNGINYIFNDEQIILTNKLPFNPLKDQRLYKECMEKNLGIQFSHTIEEQIGGQLKAGFILNDLYEDTNGNGRLHEYQVPTFVSTRAIKK